MKRVRNRMKGRAPDIYVSKETETRVSCSSVEFVSAILRVSSVISET